MIQKIKFKVIQSQNLRKKSASSQTPPASVGVKLNNIAWKIFFYLNIIFQLFSDALYDAANLNDQSWLDLLDLTLFVDWMGKADIDIALQILRRRCFLALENKMIRFLEDFENQDWAKLLLVFGMF